MRKKLKLATARRSYNDQPSCPHDLFRRLLAPKPRALERDVIDVLLADGRTIEVARVRDPRAAPAPVGGRTRRAPDPAAARERGLRRALRRRTPRLAGRAARPYALADTPRASRGETTTLPLRGALLPLHWHEGRFTRLQRDGDGLSFTIPARAGDAALRRALRDFYEGAGARRRRPLVAALPAGLPRAPRRVQFKVMSSQWGSLAPDGAVALDLALVLARPSAFEYVLVHELCHLIHADHSRAFWREVEARFPDWRDERDYFHAEGRQLKATLRSLLSG